MNGNQPPRIATWILRHLGCSPQNEAVMGDLAERYQRGHSRSWYWRQVATAILTGFIADMRLHKMMVVRGLLIGMAFQLVYSYVLRSVLHQISYEWVWAHPDLMPLIGIWIAVLACAGNAWMLARLQRSHARTVVLAFLAFQFVTMFVPIDSVRYRLSWIFQLGGSINAMLWNSYRMTALERIYGASTKLSAYGGLLSTTSVSMTVILMLFGSGVLRQGRSRSGDTDEIPTTT